MNIRFAHQHDELSKRIRREVYTKVQRENRFANRATIAKAFFWFALTSFCYYLAVFPGEKAGWERILWAVAGAYSLFFLVLNTCHDAVHGCFWRSARWNRITHTVFFNLLGVDSRLWSLRHVRSHHQFPNVPGCDSDIDETAIIRLSPHSSWRPFYRFQHWYAPLIYAILPMHSVFYQDFAYLRRREIANVKNIRHTKAEVAQFFSLKFLYVSFWILLPWALSGFGIISILSSYVLVNGILGVAFIPIAATHLNSQAAHPQLGEERVIGSSHFRFQLASSLDWLPTSRLATFLYGGLNSHAAHHLFPKISHRHYHWITDIIRAECERAGQPYHHTNFNGCIRSHFRYLKLLGTKKDVQIPLEATI